MRFLHLASALLCASSVAAAHADSFVYTVNSQYSNFSVNGTITTDTNAGVLSFADIKDFTFTLSDGVNTDTLDTTTADNSGHFGFGLTATSAGLFFDFSSPGAVLFFQNTANNTLLCYQESGCSPNSSGVDVTILGTSSSVSLTGVQQIATAVPPVTSVVTPEPGTLNLLATGVLGVAGVVRKRLV